MNTDAQNAQLFKPPLYRQCNPSKIDFIRHCAAQLQLVERNALQYSHPSRHGHPRAVLGVAEFRHQVLTVELPWGSCRRAGLSHSPARRKHRQLMSVTRSMRLRTLLLFHGGNEKRARAALRTLLSGSLWWLTRSSISLNREFCPVCGRRYHFRTTRIKRYTFFDREMSACASSHGQKVANLQCECTVPQ